jgi:hypothetical protein
MPKNYGQNAKILVEGQFLGRKVANKAFCPIRFDLWVWLW